MSANKQGFNLVQYTWTNSLKTLKVLLGDISNKQAECCLFFISSIFFFLFGVQTVVGELLIR